MIKIGDICPLFFNPIKNEFQQDIDYIQKFHSSDTILIQVLSDNKVDKVSFHVHDLVSGESYVVEHLKYQVNSSVTLYQAQLFGLKDSMYILEVKEGISGEYHMSEPFSVCSDSILLKETCLIQYSNEDNNSPFDNIFWINGAQQVFEFRIEGGFKPEGVSSKVDNEQFRNQFQEIVELYSVPYNTYTLTCGNASGLPYWMVLFINNILSLSHFIVNEQRYVRSGNSVPEKTQISEDGQMFNMTVLLEKNTNEYFMLSPKLMKVSSESSSYIARVRSNLEWSFTIDKGADFITSKEKDFGKGSKDVIFDISANSADSKRTGEIRFTTETGIETYMTIDQKAPDFLTVEPVEMQNLSASGGRYDIIIASSGNWTCIEPSWVTMQHSAGGAGETQVGLFIDANNKSVVRSGAIIFKLEGTDITATHGITQNGANYITLDPDKLTVSKENNSEIVILDSSEAWSLSTKPDWVSVTPDSGGGASEVLTIEVLANTGAARTGTVRLETVSGAVASLIVEQAGEDPGTVDPFIFSPKLPIQIDWDGYGATHQLHSVGDWTLNYPESSELNYISFEPTMGDAGETTIDLFISKNGSQESRALIFELEDGNGQKRLFGFIQDTKTGTSDISPIPLTFKTVSNNGDALKAWIVSIYDWTFDSEASEDWISVYPTSGKAGATEITVSVNPNRTGGLRYGSARFDASGADYTIIEITQQG